MLWAHFQPYICSVCALYAIFDIFYCLVCCRAYIFHDWIAKNCIDAAKHLPIISMLKYLQIIHSIPVEKQIWCPPCRVEGWPPRSFVNMARQYDTFESELSGTSECWAEEGLGLQRLGECQRQNTNVWFPTTFKTTRQAY